MATTQGMGPAQLELAGQLFFSQTRVSSLGPFLIGLWLDALGLGLVLVLIGRWQMTAASTDKNTTRVLVYYLTLLSIGTSAYILAYQVFLFVSGFGQYARFLDTNWSRVAHTIFAVSRLPCAVFFTHRTYLLYNRNLIIPIVLVPIIIANTACSVGVTATYAYYPVPVLSRQLIWAFCSLDVAADTIISVLLAYGFIKRKTGWTETDRIITKLLFLLAETQIPPTLLAIAYVIVTAVSGDSTNLAYFQGAAKVHVACLLVVVTSRIDLGQGASNHHSAKFGSQIQDDSIELVKSNGVRVDTVRMVHLESDGAAASTPSVNTTGTPPVQELRWDHLSNQRSLH